MSKKENFKEKLVSISVVRYIFASKGHIRLEDRTILSKKLYQNALVMGGAASYKLVLERWPRDINIRVNTTTSEWFDLEER